MGPVEDAQAGFAELAALDPGYTEDGSVAPSVWELIFGNAIEHINPTPEIARKERSDGLGNLGNLSTWLERHPRHAERLDRRDGRVGGVPSVAVSREKVASGSVAAVIKAAADECAAGPCQGDHDCCAPS